MNTKYNIHQNSQHLNYNNIMSCYKYTKIFDINLCIIYQFINNILIFHFKNLKYHYMIII